METSELIRAIASDRTHAAPMLRVWQVAGLTAVVAAALAFAFSLTPRADIWSALDTPRFLFKFLFSASLVHAAFRLRPALSRPGSTLGPDRLWVTPALMLIAIIAELVVISPSEWTVRMVGRNGRYCLTIIPLIGLLPLALLLTATRYGASTRPRLAGAIAGFAAGGIAAFFYAIHCVDDSRCLWRFGIRQRLPCWRCWER